MQIKFGSYRKGYLRVRVTGQGPERFLNLCCVNQMDVWNMCPCEDGFQCCMDLPSYRKIKPLARKANVRLRILGRFGLPFFIYRNRKREGALMGLAACFLLLYVLSLFVWNISFEGNYHYSRETLLGYLESLDIRYGMRKDGISCEDLEESIRSAFPEITWVSASVTGTRLVVRIKENEVLSSVPQKDESPCELAAAQGGVITRMIVRQGKAQVAIGDTVEEGQLLVASQLSVMNDSGEVVRNKYVHADADIYAQTQYTFQAEEPKVITETVSTGRKRHRYMVSAGVLRATLRLPARGEFSKDFKNTGLSFMKWIAEQTGIADLLQGKLPELESEDDKTVWNYTTQNHQLCLFGDFYLPVYWEETVGEEFISYERMYTREELSERSSYINQQYLENLLEKGVHIIENNVKIQENGLSYIIAVTVTGEQEITVSRPVQMPEETAGQDTQGEEMT